MENVAIAVNYIIYTADDGADFEYFNLDKHHKSTIGNDKSADKLM